MKISLQGAARAVTGAAGALALLAGITGHVPAIAALGTGAEDAPATAPLSPDAPDTAPVDPDAPDTAPVDPDAPGTAPLDPDAPGTAPLGPDAPATAPATTPPGTGVGGTPLRIMPLGDSITFGSGSETTSSYRVDLYRRLVAAGLAVDFVGSVRSGPAGAGTDLDNEGHPSWRIGQIAERADGWMATYQPDVVLLHIGTNDMHTDERAVGAVGRLSALINQIAAARPGVRIFVAKIIGARNADDGGAEQRRINAYNSAVPAVVASKGPLVRLVDHSAVDETDLFDKLHPNDHGFAKMSYVWYRALQPVLNTTGTAWPAGENPFGVAKKFLRTQNPDGSVDGRWWYRRAVTVVRDGVARPAAQWQTQRTVTEAYPVWVPARSVRRTGTVRVEGHWERVDGRRVWVAPHDEERTVEVTVPGRYESHVRTVRRWVAR